MAQTYATIEEAQKNPPIEGDVVSIGGADYRYTPEGTFLKNVPASELGIMTTDSAARDAEQMNQSLDRFSGVDTRFQMMPEEMSGGQAGIEAYQKRIVALRGEQPKPIEQPKVEPPKIEWLNLDGRTTELIGEAITPEAVQALINQNYYSIKQTGDAPLWATTGDIAAGRAEAEQRKLAQQAQADYESAVSQLKTINPDADPIFKSLVDSLMSQWNARIEDMKRANESRKGAISTLGVRLGSRYTGGAGGVFGGIIAEEERQGIQRIADLEAKKQGAVAEAREAYRTREFTKFSKFVDIAEKNYKEQTDALKELQKKTAEANKAIQEKTIQASRDSAVSDLISQGITDPTEILDMLNFYEDGSSTGGDFTIEEITKVIENIKKATKSEETFDADIKEWKQLLDLGTEGGGLPAGTTFLEYQKTKKPLDTSITEVGGRRILVNNQTGEIIRDSGASGGGGKEIIYTEKTLPGNVRQDIITTLTDKEGTKKLGRELKITDLMTMFPEVDRETLQNYMADFYDYETLTTEEETITKPWWKFW